jgi:DNA-directed RNA polymerase specialized sigma24 family protein
MPEGKHIDREPAGDTLWTFVAGLPRRQRSVLVLRFYNDMSEVLIAEMLGVLR